MGQPPYNQGTWQKKKPKFKKELLILLIAPYRHCNKVCEGWRIKHALVAKFGFIFDIQKKRKLYTGDRAHTPWCLRWTYWFPDNPYLWRLPCRGNMCPWQQVLGISQNGKMVNKGLHIQITQHLLCLPMMPSVILELSLVPTSFSSLSSSPAMK